ncbi:bifunctional 2',3'-cyclic-nucleotide 2'-phosphodiesterase/3'-nucleotidase [Ruegeria aquimaris]|uniref:Bifunctional 2',3'-cyclic-nucleotide 2'-phosphodiesterase/3'-nucleotidase n=1 Tax=Ruegeria aquimaris TaxID=2984333 RepID=A0ABT3ALY8_9RHOB|nr:bifunctional 2',3'-cyclic-nucleotide 2'-phosphodiesterase/3'-nucleotidase [Ruegeria sp. XHP0148]MCV2889700.1 bifunctional 2',3'-cyclic-nucleotide 2'-phosphodiesterase/3'-nucleotidase [Ruegeria sp. XHP0148]
MTRSARDTTTGPEGRDQVLQKLRILATSDLHMQLTGFDYYADRPEPVGGLTRLATLIHAARAEPGLVLTLLVDNGDSLQGTPMADLCAGQPAQPHPLMQAFGDLGYDAIGLGNHDFNYGLDVLDHALRQAPCPVICSNAQRLDGPALWVRDVVLRRHLTVSGTDMPLEIGIISVLPPQSLQWDAHHLLGRIKIADIVETARTRARQLRAKGCHIVLALAHSGLGETHPAPEQENAVIPLAEIDAIDAIVAGHTHLHLPSPAPDPRPQVDAVRGMIHGKPVVMPGQYGTHLGLLDLDLGLDARGRWRVLRSRASLRAADAAVPVSKALAKRLSHVHAATRAAANMPAGSSDQPLHSYFCFIAPDLGLAKVAAAQAATLRPFLHGSPQSTLPLLSAVSPLKAGGRAGPQHYTDVPAGPLLMRHIADLHMFPNELRAIVATGAILRDWLEMAVSLFHQISAKEPPRPLLNPVIPGHNFDVLYGLSYVIDLSAPPRFDAHGTVINPGALRIRNLTCNGIRVTEDQQFIVALNNYRANGGGRFHMLDMAPQIKLPTLPIQTILRDYLSGKLPGDPIEEAPVPWRFAPLPGGQAILRTGPRARAHLAELQASRITDLGVDDAGYLRLLLDF